MPKKNDSSGVGVAVGTAIAALFTWIAVGTVAMRFLEGWTWIQAFYFSVVTLTTVGYGDLHPTKPISMLFVAIYILVGVTVVLAALSLIGPKILKKRQSRKKIPKKSSKNKRERP